MAARERLARIRSAVVSGDDDEPGLSLAVLAGAVAAFVSLPLAGLLVRASNYGLGHFLDVFADT
ncbi:iron ABC transporter permease, partial [Halobacterium salinarum]|nr:iron ABC transporter permease [Halobacterium salinarum]